jgi:hypothetical protein
MHRQSLEYKPASQASMEAQDGSVRTESRVIDLPNLVPGQSVSNDHSSVTKQAHFEFSKLTELVEDRA